jgi:hypothetical protein
MGRRAFAVTTTVAAAPSEAVDFLMGLAGHRGLHPFLVSATVVDSGASSEGAWWDWSVVERPAIGPVRYRLRFPARLTRTSSSSMTALVRAAPGCWLRSSTVAEPWASGCRLVERTEVTAPWPVLGYMARNAQVAHARTFSLLPEVLTRG